MSTPARPRSQQRARPLTVAVTGPTGDIGRSVIRALERSRKVGRIIGMARRPFDPSQHGWRRTEYRRGDVLDRRSVEALVDGADVVVHLAFIIFGGQRETTEVNLEGSRNVFEAAVAAGASRLVYTSSVAAYGFHADNPDVLTEDIAPRGTDEFYYSAQKARLEKVLQDATAGSRTETFVFRPCIVAGPDAPTLVLALTGQSMLGAPARALFRVIDALPLVKPVLPDVGVRFQLVHHDDVAAALRAAVVGQGTAGVYNLAGEGTLRTADVARALGWRSLHVPESVVAGAAEVLARAPLLPPQAKWVAAFRKPVLLDTRRARKELRWKPAYNTRATLHETIEGAKRAGLV